MRIGIDARMYGPKQGGLGRYIEQLILHLEKTKTDAEFVVFLRQENWREYQPSAPNFRKVLADIPWYGWAEQIKLPAIIKKEQVDLMHFPHWNVPLFYNDPFVITLHDLLLLHYPTRRASTLGPFMYWFKNKIFRLVLHRAAKKARHIITISEYSKNDIATTLRVSPDKITVTYLAPFPVTASPLQTSTYQPQALGITKPYVLYVGVAYPHKNLGGLLQAWKIFTKKYDDTHQLVLVGKINYFYQKIQAETRKLGVTNVVFTGFVSDSALEQIYQHAHVYVFPSLYEGFGLPPLEALQHGVPVVSSNRTCLPEVLQDAALYFDPSDAEATARAIFTGLTDTATRQKILAAAPRALARFEWKTTAQKTWEVCRNSV